VASITIAAEVSPGEIMERTVAAHGATRCLEERREKEPDIASLSATTARLAPKGGQADVG